MKWNAHENHVEVANTLVHCSSRFRVSLSFSKILRRNFRFVPRATKAETAWESTYVSLPFVPNTSSIACNTTNYPALCCFRHGATLVSISSFYPEIGEYVKYRTKFQRWLSNSWLLIETEKWISKHSESNDSVAENSRLFCEKLLGK